MNSDLQSLIARYEQELMQLKKTAVPAVSPVVAAPTSEAMFQVRVTTANEALPIRGALVTIRRELAGETVLERSLTTGISGLTEAISLPATDPSLTLSPDNGFEPITYEVDVVAPRYYRVRNSGIPLYGGIATVLPVSLIPLPEFEDGDGEMQTFTTPPINL